MSYAIRDNEDNVIAFAQEEKEAKDIVAAAKHEKKNYTYKAVTKFWP